MFKKILLPTDGSELSGKAIEGGLAFAKALKAGVVGVTVSSPTRTRTFPSTGPRRWMTTSRE